MRLSRQLLLVLIPIFISVFLLFYVFVIQTFFESKEEDTVKHYSSLTDNAMQSISKVMFERTADIKILTDKNHPIMTKDDINDKLLLLKAFEKYHKSYGSFSIFDLNGTKIIDTRNVGVGDIISDDALFSLPLEGKIYRDKIPIFSKEYNQYVIRFSGPVYDENQNVSGVMVANMPVFQLNDVIIQHFPKSDVDIITKDGVIVFSNHDRSSLLTKINYTYTDEINKYEDFFIFSSVDEEYLDDPSTDWILLTTVSKEEIFSNLSSLENEFMSFSILLGVTSVGITAFFARSITNPVSKLKDAAAMASNGNFENMIIADGPDEIKTLISYFNKMIQSLKKYTQYLKDLDTLVNNSAEITKTDLYGNIIYANEIFCKTSEYSKSELLGQNHRLIKSGFHSDVFYKTLWDTINNGRIWYGVIKNKTKSGKHYWSDTTIMPFLDEKGKITHFMAIRHNITSQMMAREQLNFALREINDNKLIIEEQLEEIKQSEKHKNEFITMISHELKSPLLPIIGYCDLLKDPSLSKNYTGLHYEALHEISENVERLNRITMDLLDINKIRANKFSFHKEWFSLGKLLSDIEAEYVPEMAKKQIEFYVLPIVGQTIYSDVQRLHQVLDNLIRNSIDFVSEKTGKIKVSAYIDGKELIFCVQDNGVGIPKYKQKDLFKKMFFQVDTSITRSHGGTGLGLVICKEIIEGLGGTIWLDSDIGKGTIICFSIPKNHKDGTKHDPKDHHNE